MEHSSSVSTHAFGLADDGKQCLLDLADAAIRAGLQGRFPETPDLDAMPPAVRQAAGAFVTVTVAGELNGCIGTMEPETLAVAIPRLAYQAAFEDPRLPALNWRDYEQMGIKISVLTPMERLDVHTEDELVGVVRPGVDGLLIRSGWHRATFLPAVWDTLPDPRDFLHHLQRKAALRPGRWPGDLEVFRYTSLEFGRPAPAGSA